MLTKYTLQLEGRENSSTVSYDNIPA